MAESTNRPGLNVGDTQILDAFKLPTEAAVLAKLTELRNAGVSLDLSELPTSSLEEIFYFIIVAQLFDVLDLLLDANPLNAVNTPVFRYIINFVKFPSLVPLFFRVIRTQKVPLIRKLIAYGADVNKKHISLGKTLKPLDIAAETTLEIYQILKDAGATSDNKEYVAQNTSYEIFKVHFAAEDNVYKLILSFLSKKNLVFEPFLAEKGFAIMDEMIYKAISYINGAIEMSDGYVLEATPSEKVLSDLWNNYKTRHPFDATFVYSEPKQPMFSQRGSTCVSDAMFTVLLESPDLAPLWRSVDWSALDGSNATLTKYAGMFQSAKTRHDRLAGREFTRGMMRRQESVQNTVWEGMHVPISCPTGGIRLPEIVTFLTDILNDNKLHIPALQTRLIEAVNVKAFNASQIPLMDSSKIVAILLRTADMAKHHPSGHMFALFKNAAGGWVFVDNEVGFLHTIQDNAWIDTIFLPRLKNTIEAPNLQNVDKKVMFYIRDLREFDLFSQIITMGDRFYPNIDVPPVFLNLPELYVPEEAVFILKDTYVSPYGMIYGLPPGRVNFNPYTAPAPAPVLNPYGIMFPAAPANFNPYTAPASAPALNPYGMMLPAAPVYAPYGAPYGAPAAPAPDNPYGIMLPEAAPAANNLRRRLDALRSEAPAVAPAANNPAAAPTMNNLQRRLDALHSGVAEPAAPLNLENRIRRLRGEATEGGRRRKTRHLRSKRSRRRSNRSKTFSKRK